MGFLLRTRYAWTLTKHISKAAAFQPVIDQELIVILTQLFAVRAVAGQQEEVILTGVLVQQGAVVQAKVNN